MPNLSVTVKVREHGEQELVALVGGEDGSILAGAEPHGKCAFPLPQSSIRGISLEEIIGCLRTRLFNTELFVILIAITSPSH